MCKPVITNNMIDMPIYRKNVLNLLLHLILRHFGILSILIAFYMILESFTKGQMLVGLYLLDVTETLYV